MNRVIDFHTHAFPDELAERAIKMLEEAGGVRAFLDGRIDSLLKEMDCCGIEKSVVCSVATKPAQFQPIFDWCRKIRTERIIPFPSIHPADKDFRAEISRVRDAGFRGIKMHPYYQNFSLDEDVLFPLYEETCRAGLILVMHTGFDLAYPEIDQAGPARVWNVVQRFPELKLVATHLGAWKQWPAVEEFLLGRKIYLELSFSLEYLSKEKAQDMISRHPVEYLLFGTDSPWDAQRKALSLFRGLELGPEKEERILRENALGLLK